MNQNVNTLVAPFPDKSELARTLDLVVLMSYSAVYSGQQTRVTQLVEQLSQQHEQQKARLLMRFQDMPTSTDNWQQLDDLGEAEKAIKDALQDSPQQLCVVRHA